MKTKALVLDVDGVVIKKGKVFSIRFAEKYGVPLVPYKGGLAVSVIAEKLSDCLVGRADLKEELPKYFKKWGWKGTVDDILKFWFEGESEVNQDVLIEIKKMNHRGVPLYLATNNEKYRVEYLKNEVGLVKYFDHIFSSAELGYKKPEKEFYLLMLEKLGIANPGDVVFWDDDSDNIEGAKLCGISAYHYNDFEAFRNRLSVDF